MNGCAQKTGVFFFGVDYYLVAVKSNTSDWICKAIKKKKENDLVNPLNGQNCALDWIDVTCLNNFDQMKQL